MLVALLPDGFRRGIPAWMFDETVCRTVRLTDRPVADTASLLELMDLLDQNGLKTSSVGDEDKSQSKENDGGNVATIKTVNTPAGKPRDRQTDTGRKEVRVRRAPARVDRIGRKPKTRGRRAQ